jgi:hypothetical protein
MGIEDIKNPDTAKRQVEIPVADIPTVEQSTTQKEISPEKRERAESIVLDTLEIGSTENLNNFDEKLKKATKSLPRYQQIEKKLEGVDRQNLPHELFKVLKRDSDQEQINPNAPKDGVLVKSMRQGRLECAGRTLIASTFLQEHGIDHVPVSAPGHAFLVIEQSPDTLSYFDANNNLYFTFPKSALEGYQDTKTSAECRLKEYTPREADFSDGVNTAFSNFVAMPAREAIGRQYLGNVAAALNGNKEFETTGIAVDHEACETTHQFETEIYGGNKVLESFYDRVEGLLEQEKMQTADNKKVISEILKTHPTHDDFIAFFTLALNGNIGNRIPYIKNASTEQKRVYSEKVWDFLQKRNINEIIREK